MFPDRKQIDGLAFWTTIWFQTTPIFFLEIVHSFHRVVVIFNPLYNRFSLYSISDGRSVLLKRSSPKTIPKLYEAELERFWGFTGSKAWYYNWPRRDTPSTFFSIYNCAILLEYREIVKTFLISFSILGREKNTGQYCSQGLLLPSRRNQGRKWKTIHSLHWALVLIIMYTYMYLHEMLGRLNLWKRYFR